MVSTQTMLQTHGYDMAQETERKKQEEVDGTDDALSNSQDVPKEPGAAEEQKSPGRPEMDDLERSSDKGKSMTGKQPKPSNPEGSL